VRFDFAAIIEIVTSGFAVVLQAKTKQGVDGRILRPLSHGLDRPGYRQIAGMLKFHRAREQLVVPITTIFLSCFAAAQV